MEIKKVEEFDALAFSDINGIVRVIHGCPLTKLEEFAAVRSLLWREIYEASSQGDDITVQELYHANSFFAQMCLRGLELCGVSPDWVDLNMMAQLLFPFKWEGKATEGLLVQLNFPSSNRGGDSSGVSGGDATGAKKAATWNELLASLWGATEDFSKAKELADTVPWRKLHGVVDARAEQVYESRKKSGGLTKAEEQAETAKAYAEYLQKKDAEDAVVIEQEKGNNKTVATPIREDSVNGDRASMLLGRFSVGDSDPFNNPDQWRGA